MLIGCLGFMVYQPFRLFNAKSIFMQIILFQTVQFRISTQFKCKYSLTAPNISISRYSIKSDWANSV